MKEPKHPSLMGMIWFYTHTARGRDIMFLGIFSFLLGLVVGCSIWGSR